MMTPLTTIDSNQLDADGPPSNRLFCRNEAPKQQVGVADYFAVLGVGEELIWKHAQKKQNSSAEYHVAEEDDAKLLERFYREIVECTIQVVDDVTYPVSVVYTSTSRPRSASAATSPLSPSPSDVTSFSAVATDIGTAEFEGWTVMQETHQLSESSCAAAGDIEQLWKKGQVFDANLDLLHGLANEISELELERQRRLEGRKKPPTPLKDLREKVQTSFQHRLTPCSNNSKKKFYLSFRRRTPDESTRPAIADLALFYVRLHKSTLPVETSDLQTIAGSEKTGTSIAGSTVSQGAAALLRVAEVGKQTFQSRVLRNSQPGIPSIATQSSMDYGDPIPLESLLELPSGLYEWSIPEPYRELRFPSHPPASDPPYRTILFAHKDVGLDHSSSGIEAVNHVQSTQAQSEEDWRNRLQPKIISVPHSEEPIDDLDGNYVYVPILAMRRQRIEEEERFHEDPAIVEMAVTFQGENGLPVLPHVELDPFEDEGEESETLLLDKTPWSLVNAPMKTPTSPTHQKSALNPSPSAIGATCLLVRRNIPLGFCDAAFSTGVLDRFPHKNYKGLPLPEEELPMFCYPTGCRLHRAKFCEAPVPQYYGFVVKNERGDSIYVSCVSFMEPLSQQKKIQLAELSAKRRRVSLPHAKFWAKRQLRSRRLEGADGPCTETSMMELAEESDDSDFEEEESNMLLTGFEDRTTFEIKTICLISRYPYWSAFRRFLSHLHNISGTPSDLPLERYISHLLLAVPVPKPGGPSVLIPLPTFNVPMHLWSPPAKDLPLLDLPFDRLVSCLDIPTIVTIVLGFLALERKVIVMSSRPSLVLDVCELLRSLLFPFDLCAPYVPRLTEPFMHTLEFPGAIFVGIHDDGSPTGLAASVRANMPEDSTIVDLDYGSIECSGDRMTLINTSWGVIPPGPRSNLISELETLCRDAGIVPGQEPLDSLVDPAFEATMPSTPVEDIATITQEHKEPLDDRCIRDAFLRFFCSVLGGYERYLVVPDVDFLVSGNEWFDAKGFLAVASEEKAAYLGSLVSTQLFQSFIQRRTEASDVHCLLFDECMAEFHSASVPYGRLGGDVETRQVGDGKDQPQLLYSLLVDQCASDGVPAISNDRSFDGDSSRHGSDVDNTRQPATQTSFAPTETEDAHIPNAESAKNLTGDIVTLPTRKGLPVKARFIYCIDGNPTFPDHLKANLFLPRQPESWLVEVKTVPTPMLTRSGKEIEEADRRRKLATTYRGLPTQRRCMWQLPKLMGSHFLGAWLLCIPAQVGQESLSHEQQSRYLLRALGALRLLRSKQRIVPDEAAYRAVIVACGRTTSDRRTELVKLFGLLRSDGIFPSAVTLGQYTKALAEGYSKQRSAGLGDEDGANVDMNESSTRGMYPGVGLRNAVDPENALASLDGNIVNLEESGRRWRQRVIISTDDHHQTADAGKAGERQKKKSHRQWLPVVSSWSFSPSRPGTPPLSLDKVRLVAMWSRTKCCEACGYIPLEEEVQAAWDVLADNEIRDSISCPRCGSMFVPNIGYRALSMEAALAIADRESSALPRHITSVSSNAGDNAADLETLPPQMRSSIDEISEASYVTYVSPAVLRTNLERHLDEHGEDILDRDRLREIDPETFYNLWWYSARFSLPLPLPVSTEGGAEHFCAMAGWDYQIALRGCVSAAQVLNSLFLDESPPVADVVQQSNGMNPGKDETSAMEALGDYPLLSRFNLQGYYNMVWDHEDCQKILVKLVEACDKHDFRPVVECLLRVNKRRREKSLGRGGTSSHTSNDSDTLSSLALVPSRTSDGNDSGAMNHSVELESYRTVLYLAKYQCTSAFHAFFPATVKPCKGYHFWCPIQTVPIFDRLLHEAIKRTRAKSNGYLPFSDVSDVALGFRSVFGHLM